MGRTFVETYTSDGASNRFQLSQAPVDGSSLVVKVGVTDVSNACQIEEQSGTLILPYYPDYGVSVTVAGTMYKYFTNAEIEYYINTAFVEHARTTTDTNGSKATILSLPTIDEYPLILLASTMALYTLATDASFDIDIQAPDGVSIPRSERFRQLSDIISLRKEQYRELCSLLNVGMHRIEVFNLRRISRLTNKLVPIYRPQEIDDASLPQRVRLAIPDYGDITPESPVITKDLSMYAGDDFTIKLKFSMDLTDYVPKAQIRLFHTGGYAQTGPVIVGEFITTKIQLNGSGPLNTLQLSLPGSVTAVLPHTAYYDVQLTKDGKTRTYITGKVFTEEQVTL